MSGPVWRPVLAAALLVVVACGGGEPPADALRTAAERTARAGSARVAIEQRLSGVGPQADVTVSGEGVVSLEERRGHVTMVLAGGANGGGEYEVIFDGTVVYLRLPQLPAPTPWVKLDLTMLAGLEGAEQLEQLGRVDPAEGLAFLRAGAEDADAVGAEDVRGTPTTRYRVTVDLRAAVARAPADVRAFLQEQVERLGADALPMDVWLDDEGRVRRQSYTAAIPGGAAQPGAPDDVTFTIDYFDFGVPVEVTPPPPEETTEAQELFAPQA